jgi:glutamine synthetase
MLPSTLGEAIEEFRNDDVLRAALGEHTSERLIEGQTAEWDAFRIHVTQWERDRYLEMY